MPTGGGLFEYVQGVLFEKKSKNEILNGNTQCENFKIFHAHRFYVKSILVILMSKKCHFYHLSSSKRYNFWELLTFSSMKFSKN